MGVELAEHKLIGGRYALESLLGQGGMGEVWRARHIALNTSVAIKFLAGTSAQKASTKKRFLTEAQVTAQLKTRHAVQVFDFGITDEGQPYLVMEMLDGETLGHRLARLQRLDLQSTVRFLEQSARALERAHALGIVHRDFKPDNLVIVLDEEGRENIKVLDFGIAKLLNELDASDLEETDPIEPNSKAFATFTRTGTVLGTPLYMAPEQVRNSADLDLRADIWAFGVVAFQCLTGVPPFEGKSLIDLFERIANGDHPKPTSVQRDLPPAFDDWFDIACAPEAAKRFSTAKIAAAQLAIALGRADLSTSGSNLASSGSNRTSLADSSGPDIARLSTGDRFVSSDSDAMPMSIADPLSQTLEAEGARSSGRSGGVKSSDRTPQISDAPVPARLGRVPSVAPPALTTTSQSPSDHAVTRPSMRVGRSKKRVAIWIVAIAAPLAALATYKSGLFATTAALTPTAPSPSAIATSTSTSTPPSTPTSTPSATSPSTSLTITSAPLDAGAPAASTPRTGSLAGRPGMPNIGSAPPPTTAATTATAAPPPPPTATTPPPPATTAASPFKLPPLGI